LGPKVAATDMRESHIVMQHSLEGRTSRQTQKPKLAPESTAFAFFRLSTSFARASLRRS